MLLLPYNTKNSDLSILKANAYGRLNVAEMVISVFNPFPNNKF